MDYKDTARKGAWLLHLSLLRPRIVHKHRGFER